MGEKTRQNLRAAFTGEAKAYFRLLAYAEKAREEGLLQVAALFRAVAEAERVHAQRNLALLGEVLVRDSESNLQASFEREERAGGVFYPQFIRDAEEEGERPAAFSFSQARDVEDTHAALYRRALDHLLADTQPTYYVCQTCGYIAEGQVPEECPICGAGREFFRRVSDSDNG